ncbi:unnamed protein product [Rhizophagus irregularis]|nr:unnamed protein product [Rhizophagus irregularis]
MNRFEKSSLFQRLATTWLGCTKSVRNSFNKYTILYNIGGILSPKIHNYRQGPDTDVAKNWEKEYPTRPLIYINQLIYNGRSNNMGLLRIHLKGLHSTFDSQKFGCCFLIRILVTFIQKDI